MSYGLACCPPQGSPSPCEVKKIMVENHDPLKCSLCQGHGELLRSEVIQQLTNGELKPWIDAYLAEIAQLEPLTELATARASGSRDFQENVHTWNPELPMWRRSPKE